MKPPLPPTLSGSRRVGRSSSRPSPRVPPSTRARRSRCRTAVRPGRPRRTTTSARSSASRRPATARASCATSTTPSSGCPRDGRRHGGHADVGAHALDDLHGEVRRSVPRWRRPEACRPRPWRASRCRSSLSAAAARRCRGCTTRQPCSPPHFQTVGPSSSPESFHRCRRRCWRPCSRSSIAPETAQSPGSLALEGSPTAYVLEVSRRAGRGRGCAPVARPHAVARAGCRHRTGEPPSDSRPCGVAQVSSTGPSGTIPVGFTSLCTT